MEFSEPLGRYQRTHRRLLEAALELFETAGFERTTVAEIAARAGVSEMTFYRHFPRKDDAVLTDTYDPQIATVIAAQPPTDVPLLRAANGVGAAFGALSEEELRLLRRRVGIISGSPALRAASLGANAATEQRIADQLIADGAPVLSARVAASALLAALTTALLEWAASDDLTLPEAVKTATNTLAGRGGGGSG